jgi:hypothetical protein
MGFYLGTSVNNGGTYVTPYDISVYDGGAWQGVKEVYVNDAGTWRSVYEFWPGIDADTDYSGTATFTSRSFGSAYSTGFFRWVVTTDATYTSLGWWTRTIVYQSDGGFYSDTGWQAGSTTTSANQAIGKMWLPTRSGTGNSSLISVPTLQAQGSHFGNTWYARWNYSGEVTSFNNSANSVPADWITV